ncbi:MAG: hypothetical protein ACFFAY_04195 [Promethearchaeota archaeon]
MREKSLAAFISSAILLSILAIIAYQPFIPYENKFSWGLELQDEFTYEIGVFGVYGTNWNEISGPVPFEELNQTRILAKITYLPSLENSSTSEAFVDNVVNPMKVECRLASGSELDPDYQTSLERFISRCILPLGDFAFIDVLFPDECLQSGISYCAKQHDDHFRFGHRYFGVDVGYDWYSNNSLSTGLPFIITYHYVNLHPPIIWANYYVSLTLID